MHNVRVFKGEDVNSDHYLLKSTISLKVRKTPSQNQSKRRLDIEKIKILDVEKAFKLELKNRFSALDNTDTEDHDNYKEKWNTIKKTYEYYWLQNQKERRMAYI